MSRRNAPVKSSDVVDVTIDRLAAGGRGVARHENFVLFVARGLPGDTVRARVTRVRKNFAEAVTDELVTPGPSTIAAPCPFHSRCGGCAWQALDYPAQLQAKTAQVLEALEKIGGVDGGPQLGPIIGAENTFGYRNKMEYTFSAQEDGQLGLGFHELGRWDRLVAVDPCLIADPRGLPVHRTVLEWANRHNLSPHDRETGQGFLRHLVVRVGWVTGEVMAHLVTSDGTLNKAAELVDDLQANVPGLVSVLWSKNDGVAEVARGNTPPAVLWGRDWFEEELAGVRLRVRPDSFMQTNTAMAERLYALVKEVAQPRPDDVMYDLYCGIGSIALALAPHVRQVVGVEVVEQAIDCAHENATLNEITNVDFQVGNVRPVLKFAVGVWPDPTLVVVDPPRSGLVEKVIRRICERRPERIVYVSCNPATFAADVPRFREYGYELVSVQPVDQFPHTPHVELVARLEPVDPGVTPDTPTTVEDAAQLAEQIAHEAAAQDVSQDAAVDPSASDA